MAKRGLARLDELDELARAHDWVVQRHIPDADDLPEGCVEAHGWMAAHEMDDGRDFTVIIVYGKPEGRPWQALREDDKWVVICSIDEPTWPHMGADFTIRFKAIADFEYWVPRFDELIKLWRDRGALPERKTMQQRIRESVKEGGGT